MALPLKHLLPSRDTALHASWITLTVLVLLLSAAVLMTMGRLKEAGTYWQVLVEVALVLLSVNGCSPQPGFSGYSSWSMDQTGRFNSARLAQRDLGSIRLCRGTGDKSVDSNNGDGSPHATTGAAEGAAFLTLCAGFSLCLATMTMVITHLCYLCIRHRRTIG